MQLEEDLGDDYRWSYRVSKVLFSGKSEFQEVDLVDTPTWGKVRAAGVGRRNHVNSANSFPMQQGCCIGCAST